jgi:hypothetical protein
LNVFTNDILDNLRLDYATRAQNPIQPGFELRSDGGLTFHRAEPIIRKGSNFIPVRKASRSMLLTVVSLRLQSLAQTKPAWVRLARGLGLDVTIPRVPGIIGAWYDQEVLDRGVPLTKALLAQINADVKRRRGVFLVSLIPSPMQVYTQTYGEVLRASFPDDPMAMAFLADPKRAQRIIRKICDDIGVPLLDMYDILASKNASFYLPSDGHFNEAGHTLFAASLEQFVTTHAPGVDRVRSSNSQ